MDVAERGDEPRALRTYATIPDVTTSTARTAMQIIPTAHDKDRTRLILIQ